MFWMFQPLPLNKTYFKVSLNINQLQFLFETPAIEIKAKGFVALFN